MPNNAGILNVDIRARFAEFTKDLAQAGRVLDRQVSGFKSVGKSLATGFAAPAAALTATLGLTTKALVDLAARGDNVSDVAEAFKELQTQAGIAASQGIAQLRAATQGLVSDFELMKRSNLASNFGLTQEQFLELAGAAKALGERTGKDLPEALDLLVEGFGRAKDKGLEALKINVDLEAAETKYANSIGKSRKELNESERDIAFRAAAFAELRKETAATSEETTSVTDSFQRAQTSLSNLIDQVAVGVEKNPELAKAFDDIRIAIEQIDWQVIVAGIEQVGKLAVWGANQLANFTRGLDVLFNLSNVEKIRETDSAITDLESSLGRFLKSQSEIQRTSVENVQLSIPDKNWVERQKEKITALKGEREALIQTEKARLDANKVEGQAPPVIKKTTEETGKGTETLRDYVAEQQKAAKEAASLAKKNEELAKSFAQTRLETEKGIKIDALTKGMDTALSKYNFPQFSAGMEELKKEMFDLEFARLKDQAGTAFGVTITEAEVKALASKEVDAAMQEQADRLAEKQTEAFQNSFETFADILTPFFEDAAFNFEDVFKDAAKRIAIGFVAQMAASLTGGLFGSGGITSAQGLGQLLAQSAGFGGVAGAGGGAGGMAGSSSLMSLGSELSGTALGNWLTGGTSGIGPVASGSDYGAMVTTGSEFAPAAAAGAGYAAAGVQLYDSISNAEEDPYAAGGAVIGAAIGTYILPGIGTAVGAVIGDWLGGLTGDLFNSGGDPSRIARDAAADWFQDRLAEATKDIGGLKIFDQKGDLVPFGEDFKVGDSGLFDNPGWADNFWRTFGDKGAEQFDALGHAFSEMLGGEAQGEQLGALLAQNLGTGGFEQNLDNITLFLDAMGVSVEELTENLFKAGEAGEISWLQFESMRMALSEIPEEGLAAFGAMDRAFQLLLESNGRGIEALRALQYVAIEAGEAGVTSFEGLRTKLTEAGFSTQNLDAFFQALAQRGITSMEQLGEASDEVLAGIVADMESAGVKWEGMTEGSEQMTVAIDQLRATIDELSNAIRAIPSEVSTTVKVRTVSVSSGNTGVEEPVVASARGGVVPFATGGVVANPTLFKIPSGRIGLMGEAGPEGILPLKRINGRLGVTAEGMGGGGSSYNIHIDATGAEAGVEHRILQAWEQVRQSDMEATAAMIAEASRRGAL